MNSFSPTADAFGAVNRERKYIVDPIALEKDWYLVEVIKLLYSADLPEGCRLVFNGGKSLSKRGLISRFSEDADFLLEVQPSSSIGRGRLSKIRKAIVARIDRNGIGCQVSRQTSFDEGNQMVIEVAYPSALTREDGSIATRSEIRLEIRKCIVPVPSDKIDIRSLVSETYRWPADLSVEAHSPLVIAANKLVGLAWRVVKREKIGSSPDDRNLVRHLHDLAALLPAIQAEPERFRTLVEETVLADRPRYKDLDIEPAQLISNATKLVTAETPYHREFDEFVARMSFASDDETIHYPEAIDAYCKIVALI